MKKSKQRFLLFVRVRVERLFETILHSDKVLLKISRIMTASVTITVVKVSLEKLYEPIRIQTTVS